MELVKALDLFLKYLQYECNSSPNTICAYKRDIEDFISFISRSKRGNLFLVEKVTKNNGKDFLQYLTSTGKYKITTIRRKIYALQSFFKYLSQEDFISHNPFNTIRIPKKGQTLPVYLNSDELDLLIQIAEKYPNKYSGKRDLIALCLLRYTGCRRNELLNLTWNDIDLANGSIKFIGKGNKERLVPIHPSLKKFIIKYSQQSNISGKEFVLTGRGGKNLSASGLRKILEKYLKLSGLSGRNITPHKLRHSFATELLKNGVDIRIIKEWLGHENISTTAIYTHVTFDQLSDVWRDEYEQGKTIKSKPNNN